MEVTKLEGLGRGLIKVHFNDRSILITGELTMTPMFYANISSIKKWEAPHDNDIIDEDTKNAIIKSIEDYTRNSHVKVVFD